MGRWADGSGAEGLVLHASDEALSFDGFFAANRDTLFRALCLVTRNRYEAEELMQEAFVRVFERWDRVSTMQDPVGYLYRTAMNAFRQVRRRATTAARHLAHLTPADDGLAAIEDRDLVVRMLGELSHRQRAVVVLIDMLGFGSEDVARMLGIRPSTVRVHLARAREALEKELIQHD